MSVIKTCDVCNRVVEKTIKAGGWLKKCDPPVIDMCDPCLDGVRDAGLDAKLILLDMVEDAVAHHVKKQRRLVA